MPMRSKLTTEMNKVHTSILHMGTLAEEALHKSLAALSAGDESLAETVRQEDKLIDDMQSQIEDYVTRIMAIEQPVADDLRNLIACIKLVGEIERIGDHARHIAGTVNRVSKQGVERVLPILQEMNETGTGMLHDILTAFMDANDELASRISRRDDVIDSLHTAASREVISYMQQHSANIQDGSSLLMLARYLERIGDHVTNMCECVVYARRGIHVELNE
ncbi:phosphate signaling complex protein PhoU [Spirochaeta dissipatitropha]